MVYDKVGKEWKKVRPSDGSLVPLTVPKPFNPAKTDEALKK
jgi:hypothetical protein